MSLTETSSTFLYVKSKLLTPEFHSLLLTKTRNGLKLYRTNPELVKLVSEFVGIPEEQLKPIWKDVYKVIINIYNRKAKLRQETVGEVRLNTLANSLYYAVYEKYEQKAPEVVYTILEPYIVPALQDPDAEDAVKKVQLLFLPISPENIDEVLAVLGEILASNRELLCNDTIISALEMVCHRSSLLPTSKKSNNSIKDVDYCFSKLKKTAVNACGGGT